MRAGELDQRDDVIQLNVPLFLRLIELAREDVKNDVPLHYMAEIAAKLSQDGVLTTDDYDKIYQYTMQNSAKPTDESSDSVQESIEKFDQENPLNSSVLIPGYGSVSIGRLMKNIAASVAELSELPGKGLNGFRQLHYHIVGNNVLAAKLEALINALDELQTIKKRGGVRSRNVQTEASEFEKYRNVLVLYDPETLEVKRTYPYNHGMRADRDAKQLGLVKADGKDYIEVVTKKKQITTMTESEFDEAAGEKDACYHKVKSRYKVWPSAYASGALAKCRKVGAKNWGNKNK